MASRERGQEGNQHLPQKEKTNTQMVKVNHHLPYIPRYLGTLVYKHGYEPCLRKLIFRATPLCELDYNVPVTTRLIGHCYSPVRL